MDWLTYEFAKDFQSAVVGLIVGIVGFGGVILTLRSNARLAREQHERERKLVQEQHERDTDQRRLVLRQVIAAEIDATKDNLEINLEAIREDLLVGRAILSQIVVELPITESLLREIGLLTSFEVTSVLRAKSAANNLNDLLTSTGTSELSGAHIAIDAATAAIVEKQTSHTIKMFDSALRMLGEDALGPFGGAK